MNPFKDVDATGRIFRSSAPDLLCGSRAFFSGTLAPCLLGLVWEISGYRSDGGVPLVRLLCSPMLGRLEHTSQCREDVLLTLGRPFSYVQLPRYIWYS